MKSELMKLSPKFLVWLSVGTEDNQKVNQELGFPVKQCINSTMFLFSTSEVVLRKGRYRFKAFMEHFLSSNI